LDIGVRVVNLLRREDLHSHGRAEKTETCLSPRGTTLLDQEAAGLKTFF